MPNPAVIAQIRRNVTGEEYQEIRELWKTHSIAEDNRDIPGLIATLTPDCIYELPQTGDRWEGHQGAERFYRSLLGAFPDIHFDLQRIVIGPQGVWEEAEASGTHTGHWLTHEPSGRRVTFTVSIFFPWDAERRKFTGERVFFFGADL
jgi:predicted ester cyclase